MKHLLTALIVIFTTSSIFAIDGVKTPSTIKKVTVYLSGAQIKRDASVKLKPGKNHILFTDLSTDIDENSIQISGLKNATIASLNYSINYLEKAKKSNEVLILENKKEVLEQKRSQLENLLKGFEIEQEILNKNQSIPNQNTALSVDKVKQISTYYRERTVAILNKKSQLNIEVFNLKKEIIKLDLEIDKLEGTVKEERGEILLKLDSSLSENLIVTITYNVSNAGWFPIYDLKSKDINQDLEIAYKANVYQETGTEWKDIAIILSTGDPTQII